MRTIRSAVTLLIALTLSLATSAGAQTRSGPEFVPLATPCRALDTRVTGTPIAANVPTTIQIGGVTTGGANCGVPTTAVGAEINFTITQPQGPGHMAAWPSGPLPLTSVVNFVAGEDVANAVDIGLGAGGTVLVRAVATTHLVVDIYGYFADVEVASRVVWKREKAHSSGGMSNHQSAVRQDGRRRNAPWRSVAGSWSGCLRMGRPPWAS